MASSIRRIAGILLCAAVGLVQGEAGAEESHGAMLYHTHCIGCHTERIHWRDRRLATDWTSLVGQVDRWQGNLGLEWSRDDIHDVAAHLNDLYYHFQPGQKTARR